MYRRARFTAPFASAAPCGAVNRALRFGAFAWLCVHAGLASADPELERVRDVLADRLPEVRREDVRRAPAAGLFEVRRGEVYGYVTADGNYLVLGDLVNLETREKLSETQRRSLRLAAMEKLGTRSIAFAPAQDRVRHTVYVIVDVDCVYCDELHREVKDMNARGIALRYVFYPRRGPGSESFQSAVAAWCAEDQQDAVTRLLKGDKLKDAKTDCENPIAEHHAAAADAGLNETPLLVLPDGSVFRGPITAPALLARLEALAAGP